ncbi:MAG: hypothetical protein RL338_1537, partial [Chloroflexota bacterium]
GTFERNVAAADGGALWNNNQVYVERATFTENRADYQGGAIRSTSSLTVSDGTFVDNSAGTPGCGLDECGGGAIHAWGSVDVGGSTFHANFSWTRGGAIQAGSIVPADLLVRRTTFVENTAGSGGGAVYNIGSSTGVYSSTFVDNVGSAAAGGTDGSAVFNSNAIVGASLFVGGGCTGSIFTTGVVVADAPGCGGSAGVVAARADLLLGSLASNGGPTETVALGQGSLAIDPSNAADGCDDTTDQRGFPRPALSACDAGAYEFQGPVDRTTGITVRAYVDGVELTAGQAIPTGTDVTFRAEVSLTDGTDADLTSGQVYLLLCRATPLPANCSFDSASFFFIGPLSVTEGTSPGDLIAVASHSERLTERGEYRVGAYYMTPGGRIGGSEVTTGTPSFRLTSSIVIVWDATAGVVADTGTVPLRAETRAYQGGPLVGACPITFTVTDMAGNPVTTASATSGELTGVASATASGLTTPGVYLVSMTTGEVCAAAKPGWGVVTVGSTAKYPRGTVGAIGGGRYFLSGNSGQSVSFGLRLDATTSTAGKGKTAITTTRTNLRFIWVASDGWRLTSSTTGDATTGATPFTKPACSTVTASDEANNTATYPRGTICGQVVFDGTLEEWSTGTGAWVNPTPTRFTIRMADGGSARAGDNGDWFGWTNSTVEALLVAQARPLRVGATAPFTYRGRLFVY